MDTHRQLEERRQARAAKRQEDAELLALHKRALAALMHPVEGHVVRSRALARIDEWERRRLCHARYIDGWRAILALPAPEIAAAMLRPDDMAWPCGKTHPSAFWSSRPAQ